MNNWFKWGRLTRRIQGNPVELLPEMRYKPDRSYDLYTAAETDALCALPSPNGHLLTLLFWTGIRRAEAIAMTGKRLDLDRRQILVTDGAKGSKSRIVPMVGRVSTSAAELLTLEGIGPDEFLWYTNLHSRESRFYGCPYARGRRRPGMSQSLLSFVHQGTRFVLVTYPSSASIAWKWAPDGR
jgi:integrase